MRKHMKNIRKTTVTKNEIMADLIFFMVPAVLGTILVFIFDIHHTFYPETPYWPFTFIFTGPEPYYLGFLIGGVIGFFLIKLLLFGMREEEISERKPKP